MCVKRRICEISVPFTPFCCEPNNAPKKLRLSKQQQTPFPLVLQLLEGFYCGCCVMIVAILKLPK